MCHWVDWPYKWKICLLLDELTRFWDQRVCCSIFLVRNIAQEWEQAPLKWASKQDSTIQSFSTCLWGDGQRADLQLLIHSSSAPGPQPAAPPGSTTFEVPFLSLWQTNWGKSNLAREEGLFPLTLPGQSRKEIRAGGWGRSLKSETLEECCFLPCSPAHVQPAFLP